MPIKKSQIKPYLQRFRSKVKSIFGLAPNLQLDIQIATQRIGSDYGGWYIKKASLTSDSTAYSFGVGYDVSFDLGLISEFGCKVFAFDPTEKVEEWLRSQDLPESFKYFRSAIYDKDEDLVFYTTPESWHFNENNKNGESIEIRIKGETLTTINKNLKIDRVDLVKLDIEGSEYCVIDNLIETNCLPEQLLIEFHHFFGGDFTSKRTELYVEKLRGVGYKLFAISPNFTEYSFIRTL